jgi:protein-disulfide isomerase
MSDPLAAVAAALTTRKGVALAAPALLGLALLLTIGGAAAPAQSPGAAAPSAPAAAVPPAGPVGPISAEQRKAIEQIVKEYLIANPEVFMEVQNALEAKMEKIQAEKLKVAVAQNAGEIYKRPNAPIAGNPKGDITVVEFFDYNCGYCKRGFGDLAKLIETDRNVKVVFKELPILSKGSEEAAKVALAARLQGKYWEAHRALIEAKGQLNEASSLKAVEKLGLDMTRLKKDMEGAEVKGEIAKVRELAQKMGIQGTPHFLVGDKAIPGAPDNLYDMLLGMVADLRKEGGCKVC